MKVRTLSIKPGVDGVARELGLVKGEILSYDAGRWRAAIAEVGGRDAAAILRRFGLGESESPIAMSSLAAELGLSPERARQLIHRGLEHLLIKAVKAGLVKSSAAGRLIAKRDADAQRLKVRLGPALSAVRLALLSCPPARQRMA